MSEASEPGVEEEGEGNPRLAILLAMAMFVLVVDTSLMNVSISAVIRDLHTTASGVQSAIALEALVSAAFILTNSKLGDLVGRKSAYVIGLLGYAVGAVAMTLAQSLTSIVLFWAIIGGLGASLLLPAMQSLHRCLVCSTRSGCSVFRISPPKPTSKEPVSARRRPLAARSPGGLEWMCAGGQRTPVTTENVAILFTDVVGSTALSQRLSAEAADEVRRGHFSLLRHCITAPVAPSERQAIAELSKLS